MDVIGSVSCDELDVNADWCTLYAAVNRGLATISNSQNANSTDASLWCPTKMVHNGKAIFREVKRIRHIPTLAHFNAKTRTYAHLFDLRKLAPPFDTSFL